MTGVHQTRPDAVVHSEVRYSLQSFTANAKNILVLPSPGLGDSETILSTLFSASFLTSVLYLVAVITLLDSVAFVMISSLVDSCSN